MVPGLGRPVSKLGLALNYGIDPRGMDAAFERGVNYVFYTRMRTSNLVPTLKARLAKHRESVVVACGPTFGFFRGGIRRGAENLLRKLGVEYLDVFQLFWLGKTSALTGGVSDELLKLKEEGKIRAIGVSIHDRQRAGLLAKDSIFDLLMIRYNAAHPGAERDIFPNLAPRGDAKRRAIVAYTATDWRKLMKPKSGWDGRPMTAGECYRFCLSHPDVDLVLCGPKTEAELVQNLEAVEQGPLSSDELEWMRRFGKLVHG